MSETYTLNDVKRALAQASQILSSQKDTINKLNVFPVPDGDTGTNMSLTIESVVRSVSELSENTSREEFAKAVVQGALMGARGNSGVITSQILRGLCEGALRAEHFNTEGLSVAFARSQEVAFQAVRKPVEGTILTVIRDVASAARTAQKKKLSTNDALEFIVNEAFASVHRTPELLSVLKENNVVDAGGYGLALFIDAFVSALLGRGAAHQDEVLFAQNTAPKVEIEHIEDWEGSEFRYCTEFLVHSETVDVEAAREFLPTMGDCDLMVGAHPNFKVHVHTNRPDKVLAWYLDHDAQISEVHVHNMDLQSAKRNEELSEEAHNEPATPFGFVAVASGAGNANILKSLGVNVVVSGGQTMNPSTKELLDAIARVNANNVIVLPNNSNIILAAQAACDMAEIPCALVPTTSVPQAFSALFAFDEAASLEDNVHAMTEVLDQVSTGEITTAIKDSRDAHGNPLSAGDIIGIVNGNIEAVGTDITDVCLRMLDTMQADSFDSLTLLAGADFTDDALSALEAAIEEHYDDLEIESHRGDQPLYPVVFSLE